MRNFQAYQIDTRGIRGGKIRTLCPQCHANRKKKNERTLRVNIDSGYVRCFHCGWEFRVPDDREEELRKQRREAAQKNRAPAHFKRPIFNPAMTTLSPQWEDYLVKKRFIPQEVIRTLKLTEQEELIPATGHKERCLCFNYFENGRLVNTKFRTLDKKFKMVTGAELIPYNVDSTLDEPQVIIVEGEFDAMAMMAAGFKSVISVPAGANAGLGYFDRFRATHFDDKRSILIAADMDEAGVNLRNQLLLYFGPERCKLVKFSADCKDANEHLQRHGAESLRIAVEQAQEVPLEGICTVDDLSGEFQAIYQNGLGPGADTGWAEFDAHCTFELNRLAIVTGVPGSGKSEFIDELVLRLCLRHEWDVAFFSPENVPIVYHLTKLAEKITGGRFMEGMLSGPVEYQRVKSFLGAHITHICPNIEATPDLVLSKCRELAVRKECKVFVFDPLNRFDHVPEPGQTETQYLSGFLNKLTRFVQQYHVLGILVAHPRKMNRDLKGQSRRPEMYDINGSADFFNKADFGLVVDRDDNAGLVRLHIDKVKFKNLGHPGEILFCYDVESGRYTPFAEAAGCKMVGGKPVRISQIEPAKTPRRVNWLDLYPPEDSQQQICFENE